MYKQCIYMNGCVDVNVNQKTGPLDCSFQRNLSSFDTRLDFVTHLYHIQNNFRNKLPANIKQSCTFYYPTSLDSSTLISHLKKSPPAAIQGSSGGWLGRFIKIFLEVFHQKTTGAIPNHSIARGILDLPGFDSSHGPFNRYYGRT